MEDYFRPQEEQFDPFGMESPFAREPARAGESPWSGEQFSPLWLPPVAFDVAARAKIIASSDSPAGLMEMLSIEGRFDDPKRERALEVDGTLFAEFLRGADRRAFAANWLGSRPALVDARKEPSADIAASDIAKAWFVIHDVGVGGSLKDRHYYPAKQGLKQKSVHGFLNRGGFYAATHDFAANKSGTVYEFLSRKGRKIAGGKTINIETVPDIETRKIGRDKVLPGPSKAEDYASVGFKQKAGTVTYYKWTKAAFDTLADLYVLASARAGHLLTITVHKEIDRNLGRSVIWNEYSAKELRNAGPKVCCSSGCKGPHLARARDCPSNYHGDPYAFNVQALYDRITERLNALGGKHLPAGARYGVHPSRLRKSDGTDVTNGSNHLHEFPHQSDPVVKRDTNMKSPGWWNVGVTKEAEEESPWSAAEWASFAMEEAGAFDESSLDGEDEQKSACGGHQFEDEAGEANLDESDFEDFEGDSTDRVDTEELAWLDLDHEQACRCANCGSEGENDFEGADLEGEDFAEEGYLFEDFNNLTEGFSGQQNVWETTADSVGLGKSLGESLFGSEVYTSGEQDDELYADNEDNSADEMEDEGLASDGEAPVWRSGSGFSAVPVAGAEKVGIKRDDGTILIAVDSQGQPKVTLETAKAGQLLLDQALPIYRCATATPIASGDTPNDGLRLRIGKDIQYVLADGTTLLRRNGARISAVNAASLPSKLIARLVYGTKIELVGHPSLFWMTFRLRNESKETSRWVPAKSLRSDILRRKAIFADRSRKLTDANRSKVEAFLDLMAVVSVIEGGFTSRSPSNDSMASLGIFQWGTKKHVVAEAGSLGQFFNGLKQRSLAGGEPIAAEAWAVCTSKGLDVQGSGSSMRISLFGNPATGGQIENAMASAMGEESLAAYQLLAGVDWIEAFKSSIVTPGASGSILLGPTWDNWGAGRMKAGFTIGARKFVISAPASASKLGQIFTTQASLASAVMLGVNRPSYVPMALWRAITPAIDPNAELLRLTNVFLDACRLADKLPKRGSLTQKTADEAGSQAQMAWSAIQNFIWPTSTISIPSPYGGPLQLAGTVERENTIRALFEAKAMLLYKPHDAIDNKREGRFATVRELLP